jgi:hypothetical protein
LIKERRKKGNEISKMKKRTCTEYEIKVEGNLGNLWHKWFEGFSIRQEINSKTGLLFTVLYGEIQDQSALHGLLNKIRDLNLTLLSIQKVKNGRNKS